MPCGKEELQQVMRAEYHGRQHVIQLIQRLHRATESLKVLSLLPRPPPPPHTTASLPPPPPHPYLFSLSLLKFTHTHTHTHTSTCMHALSVDIILTYIIHTIY
jgi:hypothetical protein